MTIFENSTMWILLIVILFLIMAAAGLLFAFLALRRSKQAVIAFSPIVTLEKRYNKLRSKSQDRNVIFIHISLDELQKLYSTSVAKQVYDTIKNILLYRFTDVENGMIAVYEDKKLLALNSANEEMLYLTVKNALEEIETELAERNVANLLNIHFGIYRASATEVGFDDAIYRARQASNYAEEENQQILEWTYAIDRKMEEKNDLERNIEKEIDSNNFFLEIQPVISAENEKVIGGEVLARLNSPQRGVLMPDTFLSTINAFELNSKFDYYIFEKSCLWLSLRKEKLTSLQYLSVNFSRRTISDADFAKRISEIVDRSKIPYSSLAIEILEDVKMSDINAEQMFANLKTLRDKGMRVFLDDFGSGYTSFSDLQNFSFDIVKIDRSIIANIDNEKGMFIFRNIVHLAKQVGTEIVCEGIETKEQSQIVKDAGCEMIQGFYYYHPMPTEQFEKLLTA